jgi:hypothetical protein
MTSQVTGYLILSTQNGTKAHSKASISSHPLFPAIVALWFGALFGLGSLAVRASLIESLVLSSQIDVLLPMAAPPLGMTARILLALFMAMLGIGAGAAIARRIARPRPVARSRRRTATGMVSKAEERKAASAREAQVQLTERQFATDKAETVRRRALAVGDASPSNSVNTHRDAAPLPGGAPQTLPHILDVTQFDLASPGSFEADLPKAPAEITMLDLTGFAVPSSSDYELHPQSAGTGPIDRPSQVLESYGDDTHSFRAKFANEKKTTAWLPQPPTGYDEPYAVNEGMAEEPELGSEPEFIDVSQLTSGAQIEAPVADLEPRTSEASAHVAAAETGEKSLLPMGSAAERIASAELSELSHVELIERFAIALQQRRHTGKYPDGLVETAATFGLPFRPQALQAKAAQDPFLPHAELLVASSVASAFEAIVAQTPSFAAATPQTSEVDDASVTTMRVPLALPAAMRPIALGEYDEPDDLPGYVPPRSFTLPPSYRAPAETPAGYVQHADEPSLDNAKVLPVEGAPELAAEIDVCEAGYSSLLSLSQSAPLRQTFVRIEEPASDFTQAEPVVIFPGQATRPGLRFARPSEHATAAETQAEAPQAPVPTPEAAAPSLRRFDSPSAPHSPGSGLAAVTSATGAQDPAEAERALRSALATLQRMSGAA